MSLRTDTGVGYLCAGSNGTKSQSEIGKRLETKEMHQGHCLAQPRTSLKVKTMVLFLSAYGNTAFGGGGQFLKKHHNHSIYNPGKCGIFTLAL